MEWTKTKDRLPEKPGRRPYEHVDCWIYVDGLVLNRPWNCEHEVWDDVEGDDFEYEPTKPTHWVEIIIPKPPKE